MINSRTKLFKLWCFCFAFTVVGRHYRPAWCQRLWSVVIYHAAYTDADTQASVLLFDFRSQWQIVSITSWFQYVMIQGLCVCALYNGHFIFFVYTNRNASMHSFNIFSSMSFISWWTVCVSLQHSPFEMFIIQSSEQIFRSTRLFELRSSYIVHHLLFPLFSPLVLSISLSVCLSVRSQCCHDTDDADISFSVDLSFSFQLAMLTFVLSNRKMVRNEKKYHNIIFSFDFYVVSAIISHFLQRYNKSIALTETHRSAHSHRHSQRKKMVNPFVTWIPKTFAFEDDGIAWSVVLVETRRNASISIFQLENVFSKMREFNFLWRWMRKCHTTTTTTAATKCRILFYLFRFK